MIFIEDIRTCSLWLKEKSVYRPNYYVEFYKNSPWIHQPMEIYETMTIDELKYKND